MNSRTPQLAVLLVALLVVAGGVLAVTGGAPLADLDSPADPGTDTDDSDPTDPNTALPDSTDAGPTDSGPSDTANDEPTARDRTPSTDGPSDDPAGGPGGDGSIGSNGGDGALAAPNATGLAAFDSAAAFEAYVRAGRLQAGGGRVSGDSAAVEVEAEAGGQAGQQQQQGGADAGDAKAKQEDGAGAAGGGPARVSDTNVQVTGIDEPDIVKTDGRSIFYAGPRGRAGIPEPVPVEESMAVEQVPREAADGGDGGAGDDGSADDETHVIDALPANATGVAATVDSSGDLLLVNNTLVVIGTDRIAGYDVAEPANPTLDWERELADRVVTARLQNGTVYLVTASDLRADDGPPCPVEPVANVTVDCTDVLHPSRPVPVDTTYTALALDPGSGDVNSMVSIVGSRESVVSMFPDGLYLTHTERTGASSQLRFLLDQRDLLDGWVAERLDQLGGYNLSDRALRAELDAVLGSWLGGMTTAEREAVRGDLRARYRESNGTRQYPARTTHVVRIAIGGNGSTDGAAREAANGTADGTGPANATAGGTSSLSVAAVGAVPGRPLNQFSLDEHEGHLRIATTVGGGESPLGFRPTQPENDVYVLDATGLNVTGSVTGMGENERIYAVRFVGEEGYVVTFRRIDPFHVLDLSNPENPREAGELELPGFSTYLHPLSEDRILGIGEEEGQVKAVVFDVADPSNPRIADESVLDAGWSAVSESHHAFLLDRKHEVFFLPTSEGGRVYDYTDGLSIEHTVGIENPQRALYIDDYLYVFGEHEVAVVNETSWERVRTVELDG
ncbi:hypothetical protein BRC90_12160 [Halobacteriales archaeon QS_4_69_34]|nr:MAG: hypothetical protein BRC90_12160 [Halobacteriales archaeon QS_4_69_34]